MVVCISYSSFALPEALLFVTKPNPASNRIFSQLQLKARFIPRQATSYILYPLTLYPQNSQVYGTGRRRDWNLPWLNRIESSAPKASDRFCLETTCRTEPSTRTCPPFRRRAREKQGKISSTCCVTNTRLGLLSLEC